jgi:predicted small lipoprotein YifL
MTRCFGPGSRLPPAIAARRVAVVILVTLALSACGRKGPVLPPGSRVPQPVSELSGVIEEDGSVRLSWRNPTRRTDNVRLRDLAIERLYRVEDMGVGDPKPALLSRGRVAGYAEILTIRFPSTSAPPSPPPSLPPGVVMDGDHVRVSDRTGLRAGRRYTYVVIAEDSQGRESAPSARVSLALISPAEPPSTPTARAGEGEVHLAWTPPARLDDGGAISGTLTYEVLRAAEPDAPLVALTPIPVSEPTFTDRGAANDHTYAYAIRAIRTQGTTTVRGRPSERVTATPRDVTPPSPPPNLVAIPSVGTVRLRWDPSSEADVTRYIVYRAPSGGEPARVGSVEPPSTVFVDTNVSTGTYRYTVTAIDGALTPNESAPSNEVRVSVP